MTDARLRHSWLRIDRVRRVMLHTRWNAEAWSEVRVEFKRALDECLIPLVLLLGPWIWRGLSIRRSA